MEVVADVGAIELPLPEIVLGLVVDAEDDGALIRVFFDEIHFLPVDGSIYVFEVVFVKAKCGDDLFVFVELNLEVLDVSVDGELGFGFVSN